MTYTIVKNIGGITYILSSRLSICFLNKSKLFYIYYKIKENFFAKSYYINEHFLEDKMSYDDEEDRYIADFLKVNPEIKNQIKKIIKYHNIL
jgi:hypothetical protein